jgi:hypothetical protein
MGSAVAGVYFSRQLVPILALLAAAGVGYGLARVSLFPLLAGLQGAGDRMGAFAGLFFMSYELAAIAGPPAAGGLVSLVGGNYFLIFPLMALACFSALPFAFGLLRDEMPTAAPLWLRR